MTKDANSKRQIQSQVTNPASSFKPMSILSRPSQMPPRSPAVQGTFGAGADDVLKNLLGSKGLPTAEESNLLTRKDGDASTTILKRPQLMQPSMPAELAAPSPSFLPGMSTQPTLERRRSQALEHKQALLSLFKHGPAVTPSPILEPTRASEGPERALNDTSDVMNRPRVGSLVSHGSDLLPESSSRRGSHAPISAADKGFLLEYLDAITKGKAG
jgi:mRNA-decapping enzyme subunit 2